MEKKNKKTLWIILSVVVAIAIIIFSASVGKQSEETVCEVCEVCPEQEVITKEVEKIVYRDSVATLDDLEIYRNATSVLSEGYVTMFPVAQIAMDDYGVPMHQDWKDLLEIAEYFDKDLN